MFLALKIDPMPTDSTEYIFETTLQRAKFRSNDDFNIFINLAQKMTSLNVCHQSTFMRSCTYHVTRVVLACNIIYETLIEYKEVYNGKASETVSFLIKVRYEHPGVIFSPFTSL